MKNDGHTTSGLDAAMQAHADQQHPLNNSGRPVPNRDINKSAPGARTPDAVLWSYYQGEKSGYTKNGVVQHPFNPGKDK